MIVNDRNEQSRQIIDDYLKLSRSLIDKREANNTIQYGYAVACLILCAIDAIGHRVRGREQSLGCTQFGILKNIIVDEDIDDQNIEDILKFFRAGLIHAGVMLKGVSISGEGEKVFNYDSGRVSEICLPKLLVYVENYWSTVRDQESLASIKADARGPSMNFTANSIAASGVVEIPHKP